MEKKNIFWQAEKLLKGNINEINSQLPIEDQTELIPYDVRWEFPKHRLKFGSYSQLRVQFVIVW